MTTEVLEFYISRDGRYVGANEAALATLGYSLEELRTKTVGTVSRGDPRVSLELWQQYVVGEVALPGERAVELLTRAGEVLAGTFLGVTTGGPRGSYVSRVRLASPESPPSSRGMLHIILGEWRRAEARLRDLPSGDDARPLLEEEVEELRELYQHESSRTSYRVSAET